jgi:hypothetical protein
VQLRIDAERVEAFEVEVLEVGGDGFRITWNW